MKHIQKQTDSARIEDFPEIKAEGICFQIKTFEELEHYLQTGSFPDANQARGQRQPEARQNRQVERETPATPVHRRPTSYNEEDNF